MRKKKRVLTQQNAFSSAASAQKGPKSKERDLYFLFLEMKWPLFLFTLFSLYLFANLVFASLFFLLPPDKTGAPAVSNSFLQCFFFSVQTFSTIGYGHLVPKGTMANAIVIFEAAFGLISVAATTGLIFAKFSRPESKILFSNKMILSDFNGKKKLSFRMGNTRGNDIIEAKISVSVLIDETTAEGEHMRRIKELNLERSQTPFLRLTWSVFHNINKDSPFFQSGQPDNLKAIAITFSGHDGSLSSTIYDRHIYQPTDIAHGKYFEDIVMDNEDGSVSIDYSKFHELK